MSRWMLLISLLFALPLAGCPEGPSTGGDDDDSVGDDDDAADDDDASGPFPLVQDLDPGQNEQAHPGQEPILATFNIAPDADSGLALFGPGDVAVPGTSSRQDGDRTLVFTPDEPLEPETAYSVQLTWNHPDSPLDYGFQTSDAGSGLDDPPDLVGRTYVLSLRDANIVKPAGIGALLDNFLPDEPIVIGLDAVSDFSPAAQPGVHAHGAIAATAEGPYYQHPCEETFALTWGPDESFGTLDDRPANFTDPGIVIGPSVLSITVQNVEMNLSELIMDGFFSTDLSELVLTSFTAVLDTRTLSEAINPAGGPGVTCELLAETINVECEDCVDGEPYCLDVVAENMTLPEQPGQAFAPRTCVDIIEGFFGDGSCPNAAAAYDPNGGGFYELCPDWNATDGR